LTLAWRKLVWFWTKPSDWYISSYAQAKGIPHLETPRFGGRWPWWGRFLPITGGTARYF